MAEKTKAGKFAKMGALIGGVFSATWSVVSLTRTKGVLEDAQKEFSKQGVNLSKSGAYGVLVGTAAILALITAGIGAAVGAVTGMFFKKEDKKQAPETNAPKEQASDKAASSSEQKTHDGPEQSQKPAASFLDREAARTESRDASSRNTSSAHSHKSPSSFQDRETERAESRDTAEHGVGA